MKIFLLGATGRTGTYVLEQALARGHQVQVLVRDPAKVSQSSGHLTLVKGSPLDKGALRQAMQGCQVLITALNISRA